MQCDGFSPEQYGLYSLGSLEHEEAREISFHLERSCETCVGAIGRDLVFWSAFGEVLAPEEMAPRRRDWTAILGRGRQRGVISWPAWRAAAAAALITAGLSFWTISSYSAHTRKQLEAQLSQERQQSVELTRARDEALSRANQLSARSQTPASQVQTPQRDQLPDTRPRQVAELRRTLTETQQQLSNAQESLNRSQTELTQVRGQIDQQETELATLRTGQTALRNRANSAEAQQRQALDRVQTLQSEMTRLDEERKRLLAVVQVRQRQSDQNLRLISFLTVPGTRLIQLAGTESAPGARGYLLLDRNNRVLLSQSGLPELAPGRTYQLWFVRTRGTPVVSAGLFSGGTGAAGEVQFNPGNLAEGLSAVAVTDEPAGGSSLPTGHKLLIGSVRTS